MSEGPPRTEASRLSMMKKFKIVKLRSNIELKSIIQIATFEKETNIKNQANQITKLGK